MEPMDRLVQLNTKDCLWIYILRILKSGPTHAYTIRAEIKRRYGFRPGTMTAYKVLYDLKRMRLVSKRTDGRKKVYSITKKGEGTLKRGIDFYRKTAQTLK
jgi:DNA-binding PadR family transcriptional regulator